MHYIYFVEQWKCTFVPQILIYFHTNGSKSQPIINAYPNEYSWMLMENYLERPKRPRKALNLKIAHEQLIIQFYYFLGII